MIDTDYMLIKIPVDRYYSLPLKWFNRKTIYGYFIYEGAMENDERTAICYVNARSTADELCRCHNLALARLEARPDS